jgi:hypothetical protein
VTVVSWPLRDAPLASVPALAANLATAVLARWLAGRMAMAGVVLTVLLVALWRLSIRVTYELGASGIVETVLKRRRRIDWQAMTRARFEARGALLLPYRAAGWPLAMHGLFIPWHDQREPIEALIHYYVSSRIDLPDASARC